LSQLEKARTLTGEIRKSRGNPIEDPLTGGQVRSRRAARFQIGKINQRGNKRQNGILGEKKEEQEVTRGGFRHKDLGLRRPSCKGRVWEANALGHISIL
jgi:hypothetical protein